MQRKTWYSILGVDPMPLSLKNLLYKEEINILLKTIKTMLSQSILNVSIDAMKLREKEA